MSKPGSTSGSSFLVFGDDLGAKVPLDEADPRELRPGVHVNGPRKLIPVEIVIVREGNIVTKRNVVTRPAYPILRHRRRRLS